MPKRKNKRPKQDTELQVLNRVAKHAQAILVEYDRLDGDGVDRVESYILSRTGISVARADAT